jgi:GNAT superfamily N-acetyltransferase
MEHQKIHAEYRRGPWIKELTELRQIGVIRQLSALIVDCATPANTRRAIAAVARTAQRGTDYKVGYDGTMISENPRLYVVADGLHAVAMALIATATHSWCLRWVSDDRACLRSNEATLEARPVVGRFWTAAEYRRSGIAKALFDIVIATEAVPAPEFCWQLPFTQNGLALARMLTPKEWYGDGDAFDLEGILATPADCSGHPLSGEE